MEEFPQKEFKPMRKSTIWFLWIFCGAFLILFLGALVMAGGAEVVFIYFVVGVILFLITRAFTKR